MGRYYKIPILILKKANLDCLYVNFEDIEKEFIVAKKKGLNFKEPITETLISRIYNTLEIRPGQATFDRTITKRAEKGISLYGSTVILDTRQEKVDPATKQDIENWFNRYESSIFKKWYDNKQKIDSEYNKKEIKNLVKKLKK